MARSPFTDPLIPSLLSVVGMASVYLVHLRVGPLSNLELLMGSGASVIFATMLSVSLRMMRKGGGEAAADEVPSDPAELAAALKAARGEAQRATEKLMAFSNGVRVVTSTEPVETLFARLMAVLPRELAVKRISAYTLEGGVPHVAGHEGYGPNQLKALLEGPVAPVVAWVAREKRLYAGGPTPEASLREALAGTIPPVCVVPVKHEDEVLAVISVDEMAADTPEARVRAREVLVLLAVPLGARLRQARDLASAAATAAAAPAGAVASEGGERISGEQIAIAADTLAGRPAAGAMAPPAAAPAGPAGSVIKDTATRLFVWSHAYEVLCGEVVRSQRYGHPLSFLLMRVDDLTEVTKDLGEAARDELLALVAPILDRTRKGIDLPFRYSDEVVGLLLPHISRKQVSSLGARFLEMVAAISPPPSLSARVPRLTASMGLTSMPEVFASPEGVLQAATGGLDAARKGGGNQAVWVATDGRGVVLRGPAS